MIAAAPRHVLTLAELDRETWASCGPAALAALLGRPLAEVRHAFPNQREGRTWTNLPMMREALSGLMLGLRVSETGIDRSPDYRQLHARQRSWPTCGLALIQFRGSWDAMPVNHPAQLQRTHWIAVAPAGHPVGCVSLTCAAVFDVNHLDLDGSGFSVGVGGWVRRETWELTTVPILAEGHGKRATGGWWIRAALEVTPC